MSQIDLSYNQASLLCPPRLLCELRWCSDHFNPFDLFKPLRICLNDSQNAKTLQHHSPSLTQMSLTASEEPQAPSPDSTFTPASLGISRGAPCTVRVRKGLTCWVCCPWHREHPHPNILLMVLKPVSCPFFIHSLDVTKGPWAETGLCVTECYISEQYLVWQKPNATRHRTNASAYLLVTRSLIIIVDILKQSNKQTNPFTSKFEL